MLRTTTTKESTTTTSEATTEKPVTDKPTIATGAPTGCPQVFRAFVLLKKIGEPIIDQEIDKDLFIDSFTFYEK